MFWSINEMSVNEIDSRNNRWKKTNPPSQKARITNSMFIEAGQGDITVYLSRLEENSVNKMVMISLPELKKKFMVILITHTDE